MNHKTLILPLSIVAMFACIGCDENSADRVTSRKQETLAQEAERQVPLPNIKNFTRKRTLTLIMEKMDDPNYKTYAYLQSAQTGRLTFFGHTLGYSIAGGTQLTSPSKIDTNFSNYHVMPQADPDMLFSPASANGTYIMMQNPGTKKYEPIQVEPNLIVLPFPAPDHIVDGPNPKAQ